MITTKEIQSINWKQRTIAAEGGTKFFQHPTGRMFFIKSNADNFIYKNENDSRLHEIEIQELRDLKFITLWGGRLDTLDELKEKLISLCIL